MDASFIPSPSQRLYPSRCCHIHRRRLFFPNDDGASSTSANLQHHRRQNPSGCSPFQSARKRWRHAAARHLPPSPSSSRPLSSSSSFPAPVSLTLLPHPPTTSLLPQRRRRVVDVGRPPAPSLVESLRLLCLSAGPQALALDTSLPLCRRLALSPHLPRQLSGTSPSASERVSGNRVLGTIISPGRSLSPSLPLSGRCIVSFLSVENRLREAAPDHCRVFSF